jgi:CRP/FNR family transcriptional regulator, cyclic AMP receptor protein
MTETTPSGRADSATLALLAHVGLFSACSRHELSVIAHATYEADIAAGTVICREGEEGNNFFVIVEGVATVSIGGEAVDSLGAGDFFGEMSLLDGQPRSATITADSPLIVVVLPRQNFEGVILKAPHVALSMLREMATRIRAADARPQL